MANNRLFIRCSTCGKVCGLNTGKVEDIYNRVDSTFNYVVETLKEAQETNK